MFFDKFFFCFTILLLFVLCCIFGECEQNKFYKKTAQPDRTVKLFAPGPLNIPNGKSKPEQSSTEQRIEIFNAPFLVSVKNVFVAFSEIDYEKEINKKRTDILTRYVWFQDDNFIERVTANGGELWQQQFPFEKKHLSDNQVISLKSPLAVADSNKMYFLAVKCASTTVNNANNCDTNSEFVLSVGTVTESSDDKKGAQIEWNIIESPVLKLTKNVLHDKGVSSFLLEDGKIIFVLKAKNNGGKTPYEIVHLKDKEKYELEVSYVESPENCHVFFFPWKEKIIMVTQCGDGSTKVTESDNAGNSWKECVTPLSRLWHNLRDDGDFILANIDDKPVLLFTQEKNIIHDKERKEVYLLVSDGIRAKNIGLAITNYVDMPFITGKLLYAKSKLFMIYQKKTSLIHSKKIIEFASLGEPMEKVMSVLETWKKANNNVLNLCNTQPGLCTQLQTSALTDGLIGFLSGSSKDNQLWIDEYLHADAPIMKGEKTTGGFKFTGTSSKAVWPVGTVEVEKEVYNLAKSGFTLVATVEINDADKSVDNSLLGMNIIEQNKNQKRIGLWCSKNGYWSVTGENQEEKVVSEIKCEKQKKYFVMLQLKKGTFSMYIDGEWLTGLSEDIVKVGINDTVSHFYFGAIQTKGGEYVAETYVTVTNVLLYNKPFNKNDTQHRSEGAVHVRVGAFFFIFSVYALFSCFL